MDGPNVFFTSDLHLGHANILKFCRRPFLSGDAKRRLRASGHLSGDAETPDEFPEAFKIDDASTAAMDAHLIDRVNATVGERDTLWLLGDFCLSSGNTRAAAAAYRERIACRDVRFVRGNHDKPSFDALFASATDLAEVKYAGERFVLCHYAMAVWNKSHRGAIHLYGHSHTTAEAWLDEQMPGRRSMDVGVDNAARLLGDYRPFSLEEVLERLGGRPGYAIDHHRR